MSQPTSLPGGSSRMLAAAHKVRSPTKWPALQGLDGRRRSLSTSAITKDQRMAVADRPRTPCAGPAPMLHRTVLGVGASLGTVEPPVAHGQELQELEKLRAELIMERRKNAALTARVSELESSLSSSEAQTVSARALSDSLLQELQYAAQQVATLGQSD